MHHVSSLEREEDSEKEREDVIYRRSGLAESIVIVLLGCRDITRA